MLEYDVYEEVESSRNTTNQTDVTFKLRSQVYDAVVVYKLIVGKKFHRTYFRLKELVDKASHLFLSLIT